MSRLTKKERHQLLLKYIEQTPFVTDRELTKMMKVSIQTIRLDRLELGIPELRERLKIMAERSYEDKVKSLQIDEVIGEIIDLQLDKSGISMFELKEEHVFARTAIARGHHLFAQANSLAVAVIDCPVALTAYADIKFIRPVKLGEKCICKAYVKVDDKKTNKTKVEVNTYVSDEIVFQGQFTVYRASDA